METIIKAKKAKEEALEKLLDTKKNLDERIAKAENKILEYDNMINQKRFAETEAVLTARGLTLTEILAAVKDGNVDLIQQKINAAEQEKKNSDSNNQNGNS